MLSMSDIGRFGGDWSAMAPASLQMTRGFTLLDFGLTCSPDGATEKASLQLLVLLQPCLCRSRQRCLSPCQATPLHREQHFWPLPQQGVLSPILLLYPDEQVCVGAEVCMCVTSLFTTLRI